MRSTSIDISIDDDRVDLRVHGLNLSQVSVHDLAGGQLPVEDFLSQLRSCLETDFTRTHGSLSWGSSNADSGRMRILRRIANDFRRLTKAAFP